MTHFYACRPILSLGHASRLYTLFTPPSTFETVVTPATITVRYPLEDSKHNLHSSAHSLAALLCNRTINHWKALALSPCFGHC